jgi:hypothetical protein
MKAGQKTPRELALAWWNKIPTIEREQMWMTQTAVETHGRLAKNATGREIEVIWTQRELRNGYHNSEYLEIMK